MQKSKVFVELGDKLTTDMFIEEGYRIVNTPEESDIVVFTGGADVDPILYGETPHPETRFDPERDRVSLELYRRAQDRFKLGICRGAQFLAVMCGSRLYQHVEGHTQPHLIRTYFTPEGDSIRNHRFNSTHHQMIDPGRRLNILGICPNSGPGAEIAYHYGNNCMMFQFHPEYTPMGSPERRTMFYLMGER